MIIILMFLVVNRVSLTHMENVLTGSLWYPTAVSKRGRRELRCGGHCTDNSASLISNSRKIDGREQREIAGKVPDIIKTRHKFQKYSFLKVSLNSGQEAESVFFFSRGTNPEVKSHQIHLGHPATFDATTIRRYAVTGVRMEARKQKAPKGNPEKSFLR